MELEEKVRLMKVLGKGSELANEDNDTLETYLLLAEQKLLNHIYPYGKGKVELDSKYDTKQIELAIILYNQNGAEGEESHSENGVTRKYVSEEKFLASIPRKVGLPK